MKASSVLLWNERFSFRFLRRAHSFEYLLNFYLASIISLLSTRFFLEIAGYPIVGWGQIHIAHTLAGGLLMFGGILLQMLYVDRRIMQFSSYLAGLGFGLFIDEIGKFVTKDNNYFYKPTIVIIYLIYISIFLLLYRIRYASPLTNEERIANAVVEPKMLYPGFLWRLHESISRRYRKFASNQHFQILIQVILLGYTAFVFVHICISVLFLHVVTDSFIATGKVVSNALAAFFIVIGITFLRRSRIIAYSWYQRAILIWIFITQLLIFYEDQFSAVVYLIGSLILLTSIRYMIQEEKIINSERKHSKKNTNNL